MAKATAECKCATCGREFIVTTFKQNRREATSWENWAASHMDECDECRKKRIQEQRDEDNADAAAEARVNGWPEMTGSEKQVAWAITIRKEICDQIMKDTAGANEDLTRACLEEMMNAHDKASWWIDNRNCWRFGAFMRELRQIEIRLSAEDNETDAAEEEAMDDEATVAHPEEARYDGIADITANDTAVSARYERNDRFRSIVTGLGYKWDAERGEWAMKIGPTTGTASERAAELGNRLLNAGFSVRIQDADTLRNAIEGKYAPRKTRWIVTYASHPDRFYIRWGRGEEDSKIYGIARTITGSRYETGEIWVPVGRYKEIQDFAEAYGFSLTAGAERMLKECTGITVKPAQAAKTGKNEKSVLDSSREVLEDLKD